MQALVPVNAARNGSALPRGSVRMGQTVQPRRIPARDLQKNAVRDLRKSVHSDRVDQINLLYLKIFSFLWTNQIRLGHFP